MSPNIGASAAMAPALPQLDPATDEAFHCQISALKEKISGEKGWDPKHQKLIYSGMLSLLSG